MRGLLRLLTVVLAAASATGAAAAWPVGQPGQAAARAVLLGVGPQPVATVTGALTRTVGLTWTAAPGAAGYVVIRYNSLAIAETPGGSCAGTGGVVPTTSCSDPGLLPSQSYTYTVTPAAGSWRGTAGTPRAVTT
jgi:hypothetical protein